jgi:putative membrane protein
VIDLFVWEWEWQLPLIGTLVIAELGFFAVWARRTSRGCLERRSSSALALFTAGLLVFALSVMSPIGANDERLLSMHMIEHDLLMWVTAPLLVSGLLALVADGRWLPASLGRSIAFLTHPIVAFTISTVLLWAWHAPAAYGLALTNMPVHGVEHLSFLVAYIIFWWPLIAAPSVLGGLQSSAARVGYLLAGAMQSGLLGALLTFATSSWYPHYALVPGATVASALADQRLAGAIMWYPGAIVFALAAALTLRAPVRESVAVAG